MASTSPHTSKDFDEKLDQAQALFQQMAARVYRQLEDAMDCLASGATLLIEQVLQHETVINALERSIDELAGQIVARRAPTAGDLRLLLALTKATTDLERIGDEAKKIALHARHISASHWPMRPRYAEIAAMGRTALEMLRRALAAFDLADDEAAAELAKRDATLNDGLRATLKQLIGYMVEDPRTISDCLDVLFVAKSLERIGDHAVNISEYVHYARSGEDVRHTSSES